MPTPVVHASIRPHSVFSRDRPSGTVLVSCTFGGVRWLTVPHGDVAAHFARGSEVKGDA